MTEPEKADPENLPDLPDVEEPLLEVAHVDVAIVAALPAVAVAGKKSLGAKEPINFKWKLVGLSQGVALTLFKSVEREEIDAQLERLQKDGYYTELRILDINEKVLQPNPPKAAKKVTRKDHTPGKASKPRSPRSDEPSHGVAPPPGATRPATIASSTSKAAVKPLKKKPPAPTPASKRPAKKK